MKFVQAWYTLRSLVLRGPWLSARLLAAGKRYEKELGINTAGFRHSASRSHFHYQGAPYPALMRIFNEIYPLAPRFALVDIGCGMGRVLFAAEYSGYKDLTGIEIDGDLLREAKLNLQKYQRRQEGAVFRFVKADASEFQYKNVPTVYFLFNPFNEEVLEKGLKRK